VAYSPLGRGFLTGAYRSPDDFGEGDFRKDLPRFSAEVRQRRGKCGEPAHQSHPWRLGLPQNFPKNLKLVESLTHIAESKGCTPGQLTLAWLLAQGDDILPIPGTTQVKNLEANWRALQVSLSPEEERAVRAEVEKAEGECRLAGHVQGKHELLTGNNPLPQLLGPAIPRACLATSMPTLQHWRDSTAWNI
jgi:aryl-alcohol dehydrogenase-like predicted oxidoreductase